MNEQEKLELIVKTLDSKRGEDIQALKISDLTILADYFVIVNGTSNTHTRTLADEVEFQLSQKGIEPLRRESDTGNTWIILGLRKTTPRTAETSGSSAGGSLSFPARL